MRKDYYSILEVSKNCNQEEIKAAFRKKAMQLHPDKNPNDSSAELKFLDAMEAYEVLLDPARRKKYDQEQHYYFGYRKQSTQSKANSPKQKNYSFSEAEFLQRQEMARRYRDKLRREQAEEESKLPSYSDFKYVMISIPLAIALLFFVLNRSQSGDEHRLSQQQLEMLKKHPRSAVDPGLPSPEKSVKINMSISPLATFFSSDERDSLTGAVLRIENPSDAEVVVCLVALKRRQVIRNCFINPGYFYLMDKIPGGNYSLQLMYGKNWNVANINPIDSLANGMFDSVITCAKIPIGKINAKSVENASAFPYQVDKKIVIPAVEELKQSNKLSLSQFFYPNGIRKMQR